MGGKGSRGMSKKMNSPETWAELVKHLESANLKSQARRADIQLLCLDAMRMGVEVVVVNPVNVSLAVNELKGSTVKVAAAVSYPVGGDPADHKAHEVREAAEDGASVIYMLMAVGAFRDGWIKDQTLPEIRGLVQGAAGRPTRLITETSVLTPEQRQKICQIAIDEGVNALVAATGFERSNLPKLSDQDIKDLVQFGKNKLEIMVMDGFGTLDGIRAYLDQGVSRICTEHASAIWKNAPVKNI
jgi:deoxyribose-phosphate aldolase